MSNETSIKRFGEKLNALRAMRGLTLKDLALALGLTAHGYISELESGKKIPTAALALKIAQFFGVSLDELLQDDVALRNTPSEKSMPLPLIERPPTPQEVEKLRLLLSTYQDGTGMLQIKGGLTLPGWRDFERAVALAFDGEAQESKAIFDVLLTDKQNPQVSYGISCKMRAELNKIGRKGRVSLELSNSAGQFWQYLNAQGINQANYRDFPQEIGQALIEIVEGWHQVVGLERGGTVNVAKSCYLVLSWNKTGWYQLHQFSLNLPAPESLSWYFPQGKSGNNVRHINGDDATGTILEWYGESGGQLKYYPLAKDALWASEPFQLEPLSGENYGIMQKAAAYFPEKWAAACNTE